MMLEKLIEQAKRDARARVQGGIAPLPAAPGPQPEITTAIGAEAERFARAKPAPAPGPSPVPGQAEVPTMPILPFDNFEIDIPKYQQAPYIPGSEVTEPGPSWIDQAIQNAKRIYSQPTADELKIMLAQSWRYNPDKSLEENLAKATEPMSHIAGSFAQAFMPTGVPQGYVAPPRTKMEAFAGQVAGVAGMYLNPIFQLGGAIAGKVVGPAASTLAQRALRPAISMGTLTATNLAKRALHGERLSPGQAVVELLGSVGGAALGGGAGGLVARAGGGQVAQVGVSALLRGAGREAGQIGSEALGGKTFTPEEVLKRVGTEAGIDALVSETLGPGLDFIIKKGPELWDRYKNRNVTAIAIRTEIPNKKPLSASDLESQYYVTEVDPAKMAAEGWEDYRGNGVWRKLDPVTHQESVVYEVLFLQGTAYPKYLLKTFGNWASYETVATTTPWGVPQGAATTPQPSAPPIPDAPAPVAEVKPTTPTTIKPLESGEFLDPTGKIKAYLPPSQVNVDPQRFQFKETSTGKTGVSSLLKGVEVWDPGKAGSVLVWKDKDDRYWIVNGHHRLDLAQRLNVDKIDTTVIRETDGVTDADARALGALQNIAEGRGTEIDIAKFFREGEMTAQDLKSQGISLTEQKANAGLALSNLTDPLFRAVIDRNLSLAAGIAIGRELPGDPTNQQAVFDLMQREGKKGRTLSGDILEELIKEVKSAGQTVTQAQTLFGEQELVQSHAIEKAELLDYVKKQLREQKRLFATVSRDKMADLLSKAGNVLATDVNEQYASEAEMGLELVSQLAHTKGTAISDTLNTFAQELAGAQNKPDVKRRALAEITRLVKEGNALEELGQEPSPAPVQAGGSLFGEEPGLVPAPAGQPIALGPEETEPPAGQQPAFPEPVEEAQPSPIEVPAATERPADELAEAPRPREPEIAPPAASETKPVQPDIPIPPEVNEKSAESSTAKTPVFAKGQRVIVTREGEQPETGTVMAVWRYEGPFGMEMGRDYSVTLDSGKEMMAKADVLALAPDQTPRLPDNARATGKTGAKPELQFPYNHQPQVGDRVLAEFKDGTWDVGSYRGSTEYRDGDRWVRRQLVDLDDGKKAYEVLAVTKLADQGVQKPTPKAAPASIPVPPEVAGKHAPEGPKPAVHVNREQNGVEISFPKKPDEKTLAALRANGFTWNGKKKVWYTKGASPESIDLAKKIAAGELPTVQEPEKPSQEIKDLAKRDREEKEIIDRETDQLMPLIGGHLPPSIHDDGDRMTEAAWLKSNAVSIATMPVNLFLRLRDLTMDSFAGETYQYRILYELYKHAKEHKEYSFTRHEAETVLLDLGLTMGDSKAMFRGIDAAWGGWLTANFQRDLDDIYLTQKDAQGQVVPPEAVIDKFELRQETRMAALMEQMKPQKPEEPKEINRDASLKVADWVAGKLDSGVKMEASDLLAEMAAAVGGTIAEGKFRAKDAYELLELGVNKWILKHAKDFSLSVNNHAARGYIHQLARDVLERIPTQTMRTEESDEFQQFSTPPTLAYLAAWAANMRPEDRLLEPSAGIGGLALWGKVAGVQEITVNELSHARAHILEELRLGTLYLENAEQLHNILPKGIKPTVVLMNPPFSSTAGRVEGRRDTKNATLHIEQALKRLEPGGRLVMIVGQGMADNAPSFREWWDKIKGQYNVRANIGLEREVYRKYGTTWPVHVVVIDKSGPTRERTICPVGVDLGTAADLLEAIRSDRPRATELAPSQSTGEKAPTESGSGSRPAVPVPPATGSLGTGGGQGAGVGGRQPEGAIRSPGGGREPAVRPAGERGAAPAGAGSGSREPGRAVAGSQGVQPAQESGAGGSVPSPTTDAGIGQPGKAESGAVVREAEEVKFGKEQEQTSDQAVATYSEYVPQRLVIPGAQGHPSKLVESAAMAAVVPPPPTYQPNLPEDIIKNGVLSVAQLEAVVYAGQAFEQKLGSGERRGYFVGDGTGVGKGRTIAGVILDNMRQGRKKHIWVTKSSKLIPDTLRDIEALGMPASTLIDISKTSPQQDLKGQGVLFVGYDTMKTNLNASGEKLVVKEGKAARLDQIVKWAGEDFDGVLVFDESHLMQNAVSVKGQRGDKDASLRALAGMDLQRRMPNARVLYASATGATEVANLAYGERLGLWGQGTAFSDKEAFINKIAAGGLSAMELVARDMKAMGSYLSRTLSFDGCEYDTIEHTLTSEQIEIYNAMAKAWQIVLQNLGAALESTNQSSGRQRGQALAKFWSAQQRFFNQILTAMQMPSVLASVEKDLAEGRSPVLQLVNTNEAIQNRRLAQAAEEEGDLEDLDLTPRDILIQYLQNAWPVQQWEEFTDQDGNIRTRPVVDSQGRPVLNQEAVEMRDEMIARVASLKIPDGPLEMLLNEYGVEGVAEVTGRSRRVVRITDDQGTRRVEEKRSERHVLADIKAYMDDRKKVLVFSEAGGTGKSYHADIKVKNTRRRSHYLVQAGWQATVAVQGFGRTHRTQEASQPQYHLVTTDLKGQKRFISTIARRLDQLGALTKGQRQTGSQGLFSAADNLETTLAMDTLARFYRALVENRFTDMDSYGPRNGVDLLKMLGLEGMLDKDGYSLKEDHTALRDVRRFLNRILVLDFDLQNYVFDQFVGMYEAAVKKAIETNTLDVGLENLKADKITVGEERIVYMEPQSGAETKYVALDIGFKNVPNQYRKMLSLPDLMGFYRNERSGRVYAFVELGTRTLRSGRVVQAYRQIAQVGSGGYTDEEEFKAGKWEKLSAKEAEAAWTEAVRSIPEYDSHKLHMITGTLLPIWDRLPTSFSKVYKVRTDDGRVYLGKVVEDREVDSVLARLGAERVKDKLSPAEVQKRILDGYNVTLANRWRLVRRKVQGEYRIEVEGEYLYSYRHEFSAIGVFSEKIGYDLRYFVPTGPSGAETIKRLIETRPVTEVVSGHTREQKSSALQDEIAAAVSDDEDMQLLDEQFTKEMEADIDSAQNLGIVPPGFRNTLPPMDTSYHEFKDPDIESAVQEAHGLPRPGFWLQMNALFQDIVNKARDFEHLPHDAFHAPARFALLNLKKQRGVSDFQAITWMRGILRFIDSPAKASLFDRAVFMNDLEREWEKKHDLPFGFTQENFPGEKEFLDTQVEAHPEVGDAVERRRRVWRVLVPVYIKWMKSIGFDVESRFMDENGEYNADYFHHQVLKYAMAQYAGVQGTGQKVKTPSGRGFLKHREGSLEPININYLESEFSVMGQMLYDIEVARVIKMVDDTYNIIDQCRVAAREGNDESIQKMIDAERKESIDQLMKQGASMEDAQKKAVSYTKNQLAFYRRMMAMGFENLGKLAETKKLWTGEKNEWAKAVEALRLGRDELQREEEPTLFPYLSALLNSDHPGATDAATVLKYTSGRREFIKERLGDRYQTYENTMPEGYVLWQPREGNTFYMANSVSERIALELTEGALAQIPISEKDINKIMAVGGRRMEYVIPANIAMTLDNFNKKRPGDRSVKVVRRVMKGYKRWLLMAPQKIVPQQVRNLSGDAEATFVGNPRAFRKGKQAVSDLMPVFFKDAPIKGNVKDFFKMGGFDTAMVVQELGDINQLKVFKRMFEEQGGLEKMTVSAWRKYWDGAQLTMQARESILRYANYLEYLEQMQNSPDGRPLNFGASIPEEIMALPDVKQRAFVLSNQLLGAYDQVSVLGNAFADTLAPFWRWKEVNFRRYTQLFRNAAANGELAGAVGRAATNTAKRSPLIAARIGALILKMTAMTAMLTAFNALVFHDEEEELADNIRAKPHLVLGRNADGSVRYIGNLGTLGDFVQWFGMDAPQTLITDLLNGHISLGEAVKEIALAPVNTIWQTVGPAKSFIEMLLGLKTYPKFWAATGIRDRKLYLFEQFGLGDEYRRITGLPHESLGRKLQKMFFSVTDAGQESYYDIIEDKNRFLKKVGKPTGFTSPDTPKLNALYNLKVALRYGDVDATERYLDEYVKNGGTANGLETSLRNLHPLYGLTSSEKAIFTEDWLNAAGKERLLRAIDYYENILLGRTASEESEDPKGK